MDPEQLCPQCGGPGGLDALDGLCPQCMMKVGIGSNVNSYARPDEMGFVPPAIEDLAPLFPHLEILELLGRGGMGAVYKARQKDLDRLVALKVLPTRAGAGEEFAERFTREARALAKLNHPSIVTVYDFGRAGGFHYFLMEYVDGVTLRQVERSGGLSPQQALAIVPQICEALQYAHDKGIVHRDIKPENILLDRDGKAKIADFGLAKLLGRPQDFTLTQPGHTMGTPHYMAPEQVEHPSDVDHRADIFSLGVVFYEMLTGELPLGRFAPPSRKVQIDVRLDEVVLRALEKEPEQRYQQASQVKTEVETIARTPSASPTSAPPSPAAVDDARRRVRIPAIGLRISAILELAPPVLRMMWMAAALTEMRLPSLFVLFLCALFGAPAVLMFIGATRMQRLSSYKWSIAACVLGIAPPISLLMGNPTIVLALFGWLLGIIFAVWSLILLRRDDIRGAFKASKPPAGAGWTRPPWRAAARLLEGCGLSAPSESRPQHNTASETNQAVRAVLLTLVWHAILLLGMCVIALYLVPRLSTMYAEFGVAVPGLDVLRILMRGGTLLFLPLIGLDGVACVWAYHSGGLRSLRRWSLTVALVLVATATAVTVLFILPALLSLEKTRP